MRREFKSDAATRCLFRSRGTDAGIAALVGRQHGRVARRQLVACGVSPKEIQARIDNGRLIEIEPSVYAVGHAAPSDSASWVEAVLYAGPGAALHSLTTLALRELRAPAPVIHVATPRRIPKRGLIVPHYLHLPEDELEFRDGIRTTTLERATFDSAAFLRFGRLKRLINTTLKRRMTGVLSLPVLLDRYPRARGSRNIRRALAEIYAHGVAYTKSPLEDDVLEFLDELERVRPLVNVRQWIDGGWIEPDLCWPDLRLIIEVDCRTHHETADAFEEDRLRDWRYEAGGWRHLRVTGWQVHRDRKRLGERFCALIPGRIAGASPLGNEKSP